MTGGRLYMLDSAIVSNYSRPIICDYGICYFDNGTGLLLESARAEIRRSQISDNSVTDAYGGGVRIQFSAAKFTDCVIARNAVRFSSQGGVGGGMYVESGSFAHLENVTMAENSSLDGLAISNDGLPIRIRSSALRRGARGPAGVLLSGPFDARFSNIEGGLPGVGNIDADPLWVNLATGDYRLRPGSPCIDAGDPSMISLEGDLLGLPRVLDGNRDRVMRVDMGAHEFSNV